MKVDRWLILVLIVLLLASVLAVSAQEDSDEYVDVIVNLKEKGKQQFKANSFGQMSKEFREQFKESRKQDIRQAQSEFFDNVQIQDKQVKHVYSNINTVVMRIKKSEMHLLESDPNVDSFDTGVKFDSFLTNSVPLVEANTVHGTQYGGMNLTGTGEVVCVVDTGIDYTHSEFGSCTQGQMTSGTCAKVPGGYDYVNNDNDPADDRGHGTHVSGIVAAAGPIKGVAPGANIIAMKSLNENGSDPTGAWVIAGIDYCVNNSATYNISAISLSLGTYEFNNTPCDNDNRATMVAIKNAIDAAQGLGIFVPVAAGNYFSTGSPTYGVAFPACLTNATAIGSTNNVGYSPVDGISYFSQRGNTLDLLAPGRYINSAVPPSSACTGIGLCSDTGYRLLQGTSQATPHVAGAAALLQQYSKLRNSQALTPLEIVTILKRTGVPIVDTGYSGMTFPRINLSAAINSILIIDQANDNISNNNGMVDYSSNIDFTNAQYCFNLSQAAIGMDSYDPLCSAFNTAAQVTAYGLPYSAMPAIYKDGTICTSCTGTSYINGTFVFSVTGFSTYTFGINTQLQTYDQGDAQGGSLTTKKDKPIMFYANYTTISTGTPISGANCSILFDDNSSLALAYDSSSGLYNATKTFSNNITYNYNTTCSALNAETLSINDSVTIVSINTPPNVDITAPANGSSHYNQSTITFRGTAIDDEDGVLSNLAWWSDIDGYLGTGTELNISTLSVSNHTIRLNASDNTSLVGNDTIMIEVTPRDDDSDGLYDNVDTLIGNGNNINLTGLGSVTVKIDGDSNIDGVLFTGKHYVEIWDTLNLLINFTYNFSSGKLNLSEIKLESDSSNGLSFNAGTIQHETKTMYVSDPGYTFLCVKDAVVNSIADISTTCTGASEFNFTACINNFTGVTIAGINCTDLGNNFKLDNLNHSGVRGSGSSSSSSSSSGSSGYSGSGGGGGGSGSYARSLSNSPRTMKVSSVCAGIDNSITVFNAAGSAMSFIDLRVYDSAGNRIFKGLTSKDGYVVFNFPSEGTYTLEAVYDTIISSNIRIMDCSKTVPFDSQSVPEDKPEEKSAEVVEDVQASDINQDEMLGSKEEEIEETETTVPKKDFFLFGTLLLLIAVGLIVPIGLLSKYRPETLNISRFLPDINLHFPEFKLPHKPVSIKKKIILQKKTVTPKPKIKHHKHKQKQLKKIDKALKKLDKKIAKHSR